jgi:quinol monooxygenase YgiN
MILMVKHMVREFEPWKSVFEEHEPVRRQYGCTGHLLYTGIDNPREVTIVMQYPSADAAQAFLEDPSLGDAMARAGVEGRPTFSLMHEVEGIDYTQRMAA